MQPYECLAWDSSFFGFPVARIGDALAQDELPTVVTELRRKDVRLAYWMPDPDEGAQRAALGAGARQFAARVTFGQRLPVAVRAGSATIQPFTGLQADTDLLRLAVEAGALSRFAQDPKFACGSAARMYRIWIERSVGREIADAVMVTRNAHGAVNGLVTLAARDGMGTMGLVAVDASARGAGLGRALVDHALADFSAAGLRAARVVTQADNAAACRLYARCGFAREREQSVFHFWL
jgi:dTDP-4-amino-4,6-dideoxy-D-galactose acyltransferase